MSIYKKIKIRLTKRFLPKIIGPVAIFALKIILKTCKINIYGVKNLQQYAKQEKCILMLWHNRLSLVGHLLEKLIPFKTCVAVVSESRDGKLLQSCISQYKNFKMITVPKQSKHRALKEMINQLNQRKNLLVITPDGPLGPRYKLKAGVAIAAKEANAFIIPMSWKATRFFEAKSWDKFMVPKPFSTIDISFGLPIKMNYIDLEKLQSSLDNL